jgi:glycosyltransferase 2 family protein
VPAAAGVVAYRNRAALAEAAGRIARARPVWLVGGLAAIAAVYLCRAFVYREPLRLLRYRISTAALWTIAIMATSLHQLIPSGGASGYAFMTYAMHRRGVPAGEASLIALIDTLSYAASAGTVVAVGLVYAMASGLLAERSLLLIVGSGAVVLGLAATLYVAQRDERRLQRIVIRSMQWLGAMLHRRWRGEPVIRFLRAYSAGKRVVASHPAAFVRMMGWQYLAVSCDIAAVYAASLALGAAPDPWIIAMSLVLAMAAGAVVSVPGGGGSFEVVMATVLAAHGVDPARSVGTTILYRGLAFWIPVAVTLVLWLRLGRAPGTGGRLDAV